MEPVPEQIDTKRVIARFAFKAQAMLHRKDWEFSPDEAGHGGDRGAPDVAGA
jgi:hypothetical protein